MKVLSSAVGVHVTNSFKMIILFCTVLVLTKLLNTI